MQTAGETQRNGWSLLSLGLLTVCAAIITLAIPSMLIAVRGHEILQKPLFARIFQAISTLTIFLLPVYSWCALRRVPFRSELSLTPPPKRLLPLAVLLPIVATPLVMVLAALNELFAFPQWVVDLESKAAEAIEKILATGHWPTLLLNLLVVAAIPAICEEIFFRGAIQPIACRIARNHHLGIWITALIFSVIHMQFMGIIPRLVLGALLGYLYLYSRSLWIPILAHGLNNALGVIAYFIATLYGTPVELEKSEIFNHIPLLLLSIAGVAFLLYLLTLHARSKTR